MAIYQRGGDPDLMRAAANRLQDYGRQLSQVRLDAGTVFGRLRAGWGGPDLERAALDWTTLEGSADRVAHTLIRLSHLLSQQAGEQDRASTATAGAYGVAGEARLDRARVDRAADAIRALSGTDFGINGNRDDLRAVADLILALSPAERAALVASLSDQDLARLGGLLTDTGDAWYNPLDHNGLPTWDRVDLSSALLAAVPPDQMSRIRAAMPWIQPGFDTTDAALDGQQSQSQVPTSGIHEATHTGPLLTGGVLSGQDLYQGSIGDCWALASGIALAQADPDFVAAGFRQNPNGTVSVRVFDANQQAHWVTVTSDFPTTSGGDLLGAHGANGAMWPSYLEKALAVAYQDDAGGAPSQDPAHPRDMSRYDRAENGTYAGLEWDFPANAAPYLTGNQATGLGGIADVRSSFGAGQGVVVSTPDMSSQDVAASPWGNDYVSRHVYYVKSVNPDGSITLGNPWGPNSPPLTVSEHDFATWFTGPIALKPAR